jgi:methionyl-tRNA formyltransferase
LKIIVLASRDLGALTLQALLERKDLADIVGVVPGDDEVRSLAERQNLNIMTPENVNSEEFIDQVKESRADLLVNVLFLQKYHKQILSTPRFGVVNVHPSKLPYYRARDCVRWAMICGENEIGVTVHQMNEGLDTGEMLVQETFPFGPNDNFMDVKERLKIFYPKVVLETIERLDQDAIHPVKQHLAEGTYFPHRRPEDGRIRWTDLSIEIHNLVRASFEPGFYAHSYLDDKSS